MAYDVMEVCEYIISSENAHGRSVNNLRLPKLLYFIQAQFLVAKGEVCFNNPIVAWDFGPVVEEAYMKYRIYGASIIPTNKTYIYIEENDRRLIDSVLEQCALYSNVELVKIVHSQTPWIEAFSRKFDRTISTKSLKDYFSE